MTHMTHQTSKKQDYAGKYRVYWKGEHPKPKKCFSWIGFETRAAAKNWCRHRSWYPGLMIVHPDHTEEKAVFWSTRHE